MKYAEVIVPLPLDKSFTYSVPAAMEAAIRPYCRVIVPFGAKHLYTGIVIGLHGQESGLSCEIKDICELIDEKPMVRPVQMRFWQWVSSYYLCSVGEVMKAALPAGLKVGSETVVSLNPDYGAGGRPLKPSEQKIYEALLPAERLSVSVIGRKTGLKHVLPAINAMLAEGVVEVDEPLKKRFKPKTETYLRLADNLCSDEEVLKAKAALSRAKQQEKLFDIFVGQCKSEKEVSKKRLLDSSGFPASILNGLIKRGFVVAEEKTAGRIGTFPSGAPRLATLTDAQQTAYREILASFETKDITLLHGVTSSGKTEIYMRLIAGALAEGRQALYLLPEIAITTQITGRLERVFGDRLLVYHSGFSDNERVEAWNRLMASDGPVVVLGIRSSLFLPFANLGLVVVDEEQEPSFKQQEPAPRYHARNAAMVLAKMHGAKTLLGSATPSLESYFWAVSGKYGYVSLNSRYGNEAFPKIEVVDVREQRRKRLMKNALFSPLLLEKMGEALSEGDQVILFRNRRGFAPVAACRSCGETPHCKNCDVSLTYHKRLNRLVCHYCGYAEPLPAKCPACGGEMALQGFGTEKIEEEAAALFPGVKIARLDMDSARSRNSYRRILSDFEDGRTQILIGTQMVSKGLDFARVSVVGIMNADGMMNAPDFRAYERAFQMMLQVSGRAGRRGKRGVVVLQTSQPENPLLQMACRLDYKGMASSQLNERHLFRYPPYSRLIMVVLRCSDEHLLESVAGQYSERLGERLGDCVSAPILPPVTRLHALFVRKIVIKTSLSVSAAATREALSEVNAEMQRMPAFRRIMLHYDVDPL